MASSVSTGGSSSHVVVVPALYPATGGSPRKIGFLESILISAAAPAVAVVFTNPFDTAKVRLQLQGERIKQAMQKAGSAAAAAQVEKEHLIYKNSIDTIRKIYVNEGVRGLQKGLSPAILRESSKNLFRIGMYDPIMSIMHNPSKGSAPAWKRFCAGSMCGVLGAFACNPFELIKTRLQSEAAGKIAVGHQHGYKSIWDALKSIVRTDGFTGLYRGSVLSMGRSIVGSGTNLASFTMSKEYLILNRGWKDNSLLDTVCGLASAVISVIFMNPIDVVRTRYYNQPYTNGKGLVYDNGMDAIKKIFVNEGPKAFYKGLSTHFLRIGPHFCFTFVFLGFLRRSLNSFYEYLDMRDSFERFDRDGDGRLSPDEVTAAVRLVLAPLSSSFSSAPSSSAGSLLQTSNLSSSLNNNNNNNISIVINSEDAAMFDLIISEYSNRIFSKADLDRDSFISWTEYNAMCDEIRAIYLERKTHI